MRPLLTAVASATVSALCLALTYTFLRDYDHASAVDQLTGMTMAVLTTIGCLTGLWVALSYTSLWYAQRCMRRRSRSTVRHGKRHNLVLTAGRLLGTPRVRRTLAAMALTGPWVTPALADDAPGPDLGWGASETTTSAHTITTGEAVGGPTSRSSETHTTHTVLPGESLWQIAMQDLPPDSSPEQIAAHVHRWYEANRESIIDPDLIYPGQVLQTPKQ
ncbi:MAG: LysM peptidoglycan-binding domain-containing protein [Actinomycetaceae bacterium]|nr:LysM peptidoglycan-binding domain-containing protein [Actinomycetaceae bacterium]